MGYHSVRLDEEAQKYMSFITMWGRYTYLCLPQGLNVSGDGYNQHMSIITREFHKDSVRMVDDTCIHRDTIKGNFESTCGYLSTCNQAGVTFSWKKFQFCSKEVHYLGFRVTMNAVIPGDKLLGAICKFPRTVDIKGARSFFGMVEQVAFTFSKCEVMQPFKHLLKQGEKFTWDSSMETAFLAARAFIVDKVKEGVRMFNINRRTAVLTDWSSTGISMSIWQQVCRCLGIPILTCCSGQGWIIIFVASRFCTEAERRYSAIEGEALANCWSLTRGCYFLWCARDLWLGVDHKPLLGSYSPDKHASDITNLRLRNLITRTTSMGLFKVFHVPGVQNCVSDAGSRYPVETPKDNPRARMVMDWLTMSVNRSFREAAEDEEDFRQWFCNKSAEILTVGPMQAVSINRFKWEARKDPSYMGLVTTVAERVEQWPEYLTLYKKYRKEIGADDGLAYYKGRVIVPPTLRSPIINLLHTAHQGLQGRIERAATMVWWPKINEDLERNKKSCDICNQVAPSNHKEPPKGTVYPEWPFQQVCVDYFDLGGSKYLVMVNRFTSYPLLWRIGPGTCGNQGLITMMLDMIQLFGVPEEITSDGGGEFIGVEFTQFLSRWIIRQRLSSAYKPHGNQRAEVAVKSMKRAIRGRTGQGGSLKTEEVTAALLEYRNTRDRDTGVSPSEALFRREMRGPLPAHRDVYMPDGNLLLTQEVRNKKLKKRYDICDRLWAEHTSDLQPLPEGTNVMIQNGGGNHPLRWGKSGRILKNLGNSQYQVVIDGTRNVSLRNRRHLRPLTASAKQDRDRPPQAYDADDAIFLGPRTSEDIPMRKPTPEEVSACRPCTRSQIPGPEAVRNTPQGQPREKTMDHVNHGAARDSYTSQGMRTEQERATDPGLGRAGSPDTVQTEQPATPVTKAVPDVTAEGVHKENTTAVRRSGRVRNQPDWYKPL